MYDAVILDSGPLGILCNPSRSPQPTAIRAWATAHQSAGRRIIILEIADYEIRRELNRIQNHQALAMLDRFGIQLEYLPLTTEAIRLAADLWAYARNAGKPTAPDAALDCDVILAAQVETLFVRTIVATTNVAHLSRFTHADLWQNIIP